MAVLFFTGDQVAFFGAIDQQGSRTEFSSVENPFLPTDVVEIEVPDQYIRSDGEFDFDEVQFSRVTVIRDGVSYDFSVSSETRIQETGGSNVTEAGDTFFTTSDAVGPPSHGPFSAVEAGKMVFSSDSTFETGQTTSIKRKQHQDLNEDGDILDAAEKGNTNFNVKSANTMPCYAPGTLIDTPLGPRPVGSLRVGDLVLTLDRAPQPVRWLRIGGQSLDGVGHEHRPVLIRKGALGTGVPMCDLIVSPQHRILVGGRGQLSKLFASEVFAPAKSLTGLRGIRHMNGMTRIQWVHFACDGHEVVRANGCYSESLLLGPMVLQGLGGQTQRALFREFGPPPIGSGALNGPPARPCLTVREARRRLKSFARRDLPVPA